MWLSWGLSITKIDSSIPWTVLSIREGRLKWINRGNKTEHISPDKPRHRAERSRIGWGRMQGRVWVWRRLGRISRKAHLSSAAFSNQFKLAINGMLAPVWLCRASSPPATSSATTPFSWPISKSSQLKCKQIAQPRCHLRDLCLSEQVRQGRIMIRLQWRRLLHFKNKWTLTIF